MFNKKEKIEFYSTNVNSLYSYPIEKANKIKFSWLDSMKAYFDKQSLKRMSMNPAYNNVSYS